MGLRRLKDGRWVVEYRDKETGKPVREYFGRDFEGEMGARNRWGQLGVREQQKAPKRTSVLFYELVNAYSTARAPQWSEVSLRNFLYKMDRVVVPEIGHLPAVKITPHRMDLYVKKRLRSVKRTTVHRDLSDIIAILNWSVKRRYITHNPLAGYEKPTRDDDIIPPPSTDEVCRILAHAQPHLTGPLRSAITPAFDRALPNFSG